MKKTSRRTFGKLIAGAAAALPLTSISALPKNAIQYHQNTPPDLILEQGSLIIDIKDLTLADQQELPTTSSGYQWKLPEAGHQDQIYILAVKVVSGAGDILFYADRDHREKSEGVEPLTLLLHM